MKFCGFVSLGFLNQNAGDSRHSYSLTWILNLSSLAL
jgi:hypothetical protein